MYIDVDAIIREWYSLAKWVFYAAAVVVAGSALFGDRSRGRHRCPSCWHDLRGVWSELTCPECGTKVADERALLRTRRHRWRVLLAGVIAFLGWEVGQLEDARARGWPRLVPASIVAVTAPLVTSSPADLLPLAAHDPNREPGALAIYARDMLDRDVWRWQARLWARLAAARAASTPSALTIRAYDVSDLLDRERVFNGATGAAEDDMRQIESMFMSFVEPYTWNANGGTDGDLLSLGAGHSGVLLVRCSAPMHDSIGALLSLLRKQPSGPARSTRPDIEPRQPGTQPGDAITDGDSQDSLVVCYDIEHAGGRASLDTLRESLMMGVDRDGWVDYGGETSMMMAVAGRLVITTTRHNHEQITWMLESLRERGAIRGSEQR